MIRPLSGLAACLALATAAQAQAPHHPAGPHAVEEAGADGRRQAMRKQRLEDLRVVLRLRPDQEAELAAFLSAHEPRKFERRLPDPAALTTPQRLEAMAEHEAEMRARHERMREALKAFYAALSPDQQKVFDALHRLQDSGPKMLAHHGPGAMHSGPRVMIRRHGPTSGDDAPH